MRTAFIIIACWLALTVLLLLAVGQIVGCAAASVEVSKPDGVLIRASGFSLLKDHGLEGFTYRRADTEIGVARYGSKARVEQLLKQLLESTP